MTVLYTFVPDGVERDAQGNLIATGAFPFSEELRLEIAHIEATIKEAAMSYKHKPEVQDESVVVGNELDANTAKRIGEALEREELTCDSAFRLVEKDGGWKLIEVSLVKKS